MNSRHEKQCSDVPWFETAAPLAGRRDSFTSSKGIDYHLAGDVEDSDKVEAVLTLLNRNRNTETI